MPHTETKIYSESRNGVKYGVSTDDICAVLGIVCHETNYLCSNLHGLINKWARHKPVRYPSDETNSYTYHAISGNCGLKAPETWTSRQALISGLKAGPGEWIYEPPRGGVNEPFRPGDFDGYDKLAKSPFGTLHPDSYILTTDHPLVIPLDAPEFPDSQANLDEFPSLVLDDFVSGGYDFGNWYFGILLTGEGHDYIATTTHTMKGGNDWQVDFGSHLNSYPGDYEAIPFLSSKQWILGGEEPTGVRMVGIESRGVAVTLISQRTAYQTVVSCFFPNPSDTTLSYEIVIHNTTDSEVTLRNVLLLIAPDDNDNRSETAVNFGTLVIPAHGSVDRTGTVRLSRSDAVDYYQFAAVRYNGLTTQATQWTNFEQVDQGEDNPTP